MGWIRSDVVVQASAEDVFEAWCDLSEELPERVEGANGLTDFGTVKTRDEGERLLLSKEEKIVGMGFVRVEAEKPFYLSLTNAYCG